MLAIEDHTPWDKSWIIRCAFLARRDKDPVVKDWLRANIATLNDDLLALLRTLEQDESGLALDVGESGTLLRFWRFVSWAEGIDRTIITHGTLTDRPITNDPAVIHMTLAQLRALDNSTSQWTSIAVLCGNRGEPGPDMPNHLRMTFEAIGYWETIKRWDEPWLPRIDQAINTQAWAYYNWRCTGVMKFTPLQAEDFCFAVAFGLMTLEEGAKRWPSLRTHESDRIAAMQEALNSWQTGVSSDDHRVVQAMAMRYGSRVQFSNPDCVAKTWPQFWEFLSTLPQ